MDLSKFNVEKMAESGADLVLEHPSTGEELISEDKSKVTIKLLGTDSKAYRNKNREFQRGRIAKLARTRSKKIDYTVSDEEACEILVACTLGWENIELDGEILEFSPENAYQLYMDHLWIREQVDLFIGDRANFFTTA